MKTCSNPDCEQTNPQPEENFYKRHNSQSRIARCKKCKTREAKRRSSHEGWVNNLWYLYRLTESQYIDMLKSQGGGCAVCGVKPYGMRFSVDHDHGCCPGERSCGKCIRGILCHPCNRGMGLLKDDPAVTEKATAYLRRGPIFR